MKLSVIITTRNRKEVLLKCIHSIRYAAPREISWELVIIDDASTDGTELLEKEHVKLENCRILHQKEQGMMVRSRNLGAHEAKGELVLFVDDDNIIDKQMIRHLIQVANEFPDYGMLGPSMYVLHTRKKYLNRQRINLYTGRTTGDIGTEGKKIYDCDGIPNVFMIRKKVFDEVGYFDESLIQTYTEPDFAFQAMKSGHKCGIVDEAKTYHDMGPKPVYSIRYLGGIFAQKAYCLMRNRSIIIGKHGTTLQKCTYGLCLSWVWPLLYSFLALKHKRPDLIRLYWTGFFDGIRYLCTGKIKNSLPRLLQKATSSEQSLYKNK